MNDNSPVFSASSPLRLSVSESTVPGDPMATFQLPVATDADGPANNAVGYQLQPETDSSLDYFRLSVVNSSATELAEVRLSLARALDRESTAEHRLTLVASDSGLPPLSTSLMIVINIDDANDNPPVFDRPRYDVTIPETSAIGTEVAVIQAVDADAGANGRVRYRFSGRGRGREDFRLDQRSGIVVVGRRLDFGRQSEYLLGVLAEDDGLGGVASFAMLTVRVVDENDHTPVIDVHAASKDGDSVTVTVTVGSAAAAVAHVSVTDNDGGDNGRVMCWLDASTVSEAEHPTTDRLADPSSPSAGAAGSSTLDRNQSRDDVATRTAAFDLVWLFEDEYTIQLTTNSTATRDDTTDVVYRLTITCHDHGFPTALTSSVAIHVKIHYDDRLPSPMSDVTASPAGNRRPRFVFPSSGNDTVHIAAGLPVGHVIAVIHATGSGDSVSLRYEPVDGNGSAYFDVDRFTGHVVVARPLPVDNATLKLIVGVGGASGDNNVSMFSLAELYVVVVTWVDLPLAASPPGGSDERVGWSLLLVDRNWSSVALVVVVGCSVVLGAILFAAIFFVCRRTRRGDWSTPRRRRRKLTSSYHVALEFTASEDELNNVAMATASHRAPAASVIGSVTSSFMIRTLCLKNITLDFLSQLRQM